MGPFSFDSYAEAGRVLGLLRLRDGFGLFAVSDVACLLRLPERFPDDCDLRFWCLWGLSILEAGRS